MFEMGVLFAAMSWVLDDLSQSNPNPIDMKLSNRNKPQSLFRIALLIVRQMTSS